MFPYHLLDRKLRKAGVPILGVDLNGPDGTLRITYADDATPEQIAAGDAIYQAFDPDLEQHREAVLGVLNEWWSQKTTDGIQPTGQSFRLGAAATDVAMLTGQFMLAKTAVEIGAKTQDDTFVLVSVDGQPLQFTLSQLTMLLLDYGQQRAALSQQYLVYQAAIELAASVVELDAISLQ